MRHFADTVANQSNVLVAGALVSIFFTGTQSPAPIFSDDGITPKVNPIVTDAQGRFDFFVADGRYDIQVSGAGISTFVLRNVEIADITKASPSDAIWATELLNFASQASPPATPAAGTVDLYTLTSNKHIFIKDDTGTVTDLTVGSSGGSNPPTGNVNTLQKNSGLATFAPSAIVDTGSLVRVGEDAAFTGPNPYIDIRTFGARAVSATAVPAIPGITANCTNGSPNVSLSSSSTFQNGDGVALYGCGPLTSNTPTAPTITPVVAAGQTGTLLAQLAPVGSTTYCYQLLSRTFMGGTAVSPETCTSTGPASLGHQTVAITSVSLAANQATYTTTTPHGLVLGAFVVITGVVTPEIGGDTFGSAFNGWFTVALGTPIDATHFVVQLPVDSRNGAITSGTGGIVNYWTGIQISATETTNNYEYYIYGRTAGGSKSLIGVMLPQNHALLGTGRYLVWDDFGSPVSTFPNQPSYIPTTVPTGSTNDMLATTILSGAGTTSLVLANTASNTISGQTVLFDDATAFLAAINAAATPGSQGSVQIPSTGNANNYFVFNSPIAISNAIVRQTIEQNGPIWVNEPIQLQNIVKWMSATPGTGFSPGFSQQVQTGIFCNKTSPCVQTLGSVYMENVFFNEQSANGSVMFLQDGVGGIPGSTFKNVSWIGYTAGIQYSNTSAVFRNAGADFQFINNTLTSSQNGALVGLVAVTPGMYFMNTSVNLKFDYFYMSGVGVAFDGNSAGSYLHANEVYCQACYMPNFSIATSAGPVWASINNNIFDTTFNGPAIGNYAGAKISFDSFVGGGISGIGATAGGPGSVGSQINNTDISGNFITAGGSVVLPGGTGTDIHNDTFPVNDAAFGRINLALDYRNRALAVGPAFSLFTDIASPPAPTVAVSAGGSLPVGTYFIYYAPIFFGNGSEGRVSQVGIATTTSGNQTITATVPVPVAGGNGQYAWYISTTAQSTGGTSCGVFGNSIGFSAPNPCSGAGLGGGPLNPAGGPAGMQGSKIWSQTSIIGTESIAAIPRGSWSGVAFGTATAGSVAPFTPDKAITVTSIGYGLSAGQTLGTGCTTQPSMRVFDGTTSSPFLTLTNGTGSGTLGGFAANYPAGSNLLRIEIFASSGCTQQWGNVNLWAQFKMQ